MYFFGHRRVARTLAAGLPASARVVAVGLPLGRALSGLGLDVVTVLSRPRRLRLRLPLVVAPIDELPFGDAEVDAAFAEWPVTSVAANGTQVVRELARVVRHGGRVGLVAGQTSEPERLSALLLHATLRDVEQHRVGGSLLSSATVRRCRTASL